MDLGRTPAQARAKGQWRNLFDALSKLGVKVELVEQLPDQPDMVFTANAGLVKGKNFFLAHFRYKERQGEEAGFRKWFEERGYSVHTAQTGTFEGEGDALFSSPEVLFMGFGYRTDRSIAEELATALKIKNVVPCELIDPRFYHLDTCFAPITPNKAIFFPQAFTKDSIKRMEKQIELIAVPAEDALRFSCNAIVLEKDIVLPAGCSATETVLQGLGFHTHSVELDEYLKAGGAAKCLVLKV